LPADCEHGVECHDGTVSSTASAPEASRAWLLIEHPGPWPAEPADAELPAPLRPVVTSAVERGVRIQLIRRPGRREGPLPRHAGAVFAGWTAGPDPWLRSSDISRVADLDLDALASGLPVTFGALVTEPVFLVCVHGRRNVCCARFGVPLAQSLAAQHPGQVWETTHVGGHRYAANLVLLPHGLYYGPVDAAIAAAAISAYEHGAIVPGRYRGRAGQPHDEQLAEYERLVESGSIVVGVMS
jgi:hypothetical protein